MENEKLNEVLELRKKVVFSLIDAGLKDYMTIQHNAEKIINYILKGELE